MTNPSIFAAFERLWQYFMNQWQTLIGADSGKTIREIVYDILNAASGVSLLEGASAQEIENKTVGELEQ